ncbi:hypothetical protein [Prosthecomicrobium pneumaticum]|uniref:Uncharacterized protein n=1 Tax=Prosthecomicrobium pneumaticum TaxID=81895 RepID=A0A7W9L254_9HYPH|nr:hypothetical protein [Prosthecomicrobium pneumaticum]MBB5753188.1 hypothetical protein [Prosthecomicrobium pneumaticum]
MNTLVRSHYPASRLPEELRGSIAPRARVTVTVSVEPPTAREPTLREIVGRLDPLRAEGRIAAVTVDEAVAQVQALRDDSPS